MGREIEEKKYIGRNYNNEVKFSKFDKNNKSTDLSSTSSKHKINKITLKSVISNLLKASNKKVLKIARGKKIHYVPRDREWSNIFKVLKENCQPRISYLAKCLLIKV